MSDIDMRHFIRTIYNQVFHFYLDKLGISSARHLDKIRDKAVEELREYCLRENNNTSSNIHNEDKEDKMDFTNTHTTSTTTGTSITHDHPGLTRFSDLLLRLSPLRSLQPDVLEELFFAGLIGNVQIDSVVPYILKMEASEYQTSPFVKGMFFAFSSLLTECILEISVIYSFLMFDNALFFR